MVNWTEDDLKALEARRAQRRGTAAPRTSKKPRLKDRRVEQDGIVFHSKKEADRWRDLWVMQRAGEIENLRRQVAFAIVVGHTLICQYVADFVYEWPANRATPSPSGRREVVEDVKGYKTEMYRIKKKLMKAVLGIEILET